MSTILAKALYTIGIIAIVFGVILGVTLLLEFSQSESFLFIEISGGLSFDDVVIAFAVTLFYAVLGVICLGIAKIIERGQKC